MFKKPKIEVYGFEYNCVTDIIDPLCRKDISTCRQAIQRRLTTHNAYALILKSRVIVWVKTKYIQQLFNSPETLYTYNDHFNMDSDEEHKLIWSAICKGLRKEHRSNIISKLLNNE